MTFDDFTKEYLNKLYVGGKMYLDKNDLRAAWNAAVQACLDEVEGSWVLDYEDRSFTATMLQALKTPLEGSNDSAVRAS